MSTQFADEEVADPAGPTGDTFWKTYSPNLALPLAVLCTLFAHVLLVLGLMLVIYLGLRGGVDKTSVPIALVDMGDDDSGAGSAGSGREPDPLADGNSKPAVTDSLFLPVPDAKQLPEVNDQIDKHYNLEDPTGNAIISPDKASQLLDELDKKTDTVGQKKGVGLGGGKGDSGQAGNGVGGTGADATRARSLRWVMRFTTTSGRDYLDQLKFFGADVVVPVPPDNKSAYVYRADELSSPKGELVTDGQWTKLAKQIQFCDYKPESVRQVSAALGVPAVPSAFWAFFPKTLEAEMSRKEIAYQNKRSEDIEETVFKVAPKMGGGFELVVVRQTLKR